MFTQTIMMHHIEIVAFASSRLGEILLSTMKAARKAGEREMPYLQWSRRAFFWCSFQQD